MLRLKRTLDAGWIIAILLLVIFLCLPQQSTALTWGYPDGSTQDQCLAAYGVAYIFPDRATAHAAVQADCNGVGSFYQWSCTDYLGHYLCISEIGCTNGVPDCGFGAHGCHNAAPNAGGYWTNYWWPVPDCPGSIPPTQQPDPPIATEVGDKNQGCPAGICDSVGNPVNVGTGNKFEDVLDLSVFTPGIPLEFRRYYNSALAADGPMGYGWTHSFSVSLQVAQPAPLLRVKIKDADGRALYFSKVFQTYADGVHFYGESGVKDRLVQLTSGQYQLRRKKDNLTYLFGTDGKLTRISDPSGNYLDLTYDTSGLLTQVTNNFGKSLSIQYTGTRISSITDPKTQSVSYAYDTNGDLTQVTYPDSQSLSYTYSTHRLTDKHDTAGNLIGHWEYDASGKVSAYYRFLDNNVPQERIGFAYGTSEPKTITLTRSTGTTVYTSAVKDGIRMITAIEGCGATCGGDTHKTFAYDRWVNLTDATSVSGGQSYTTHYIYDEPANFWDRVGEVAQTTEAVGFPEERTTSYTYTHRTDDPFLLTQATETKASVVSPGQNRVTTTVYDSYGNPASRTETGYTLVNGVSTQRTYTTAFQYNTLGQLIQINGPRTDVSDVTTLEYYANDPGQGNNRGRLKTVTDALGHVTQYASYDTNSNVGTITDPNGVITQLTYDQRNRIKTITNPSTGAQTQYTYDSRGNIASIIPAEGNRINFTYNLADRLTTITDILGNKISYQYDVEGNRTGEDIRDPQGTLKKSLTFTFDAYNRLKRIVNPDFTYTEYTYDDKGNRTAARDPKAASTFYTFDALDRLKVMTQPLSTVTNYAYDTQDHQTSVTDPKGNATQYLVDDFGRRNRTISPDTGTTTYLFDEAGNVAQQVDAKGTVINYTYDALNRPTSIQFPADPTQNITYTYDSTSVTYGIGRLTGRTDPSGTYTFSYDAQGNLVREDKTISGITSTTQYTYNKNNILTSITYPSGRVVSYGLDAAGRVNQVRATISGSPATLASSITYLPFGSITGLTYGNNLSLTQTYDNQYRISSITVGSILNLTYGYDANGNVTSVVDTINPPGGAPLEASATYTYQQGSNKLTHIEAGVSSDFGYDANGNITSENTRTFTYDRLNRLITVRDSPQVASYYYYNALNQRTKKTTPTSTKIFHYDTQGHLIAETNLAGATLVEYVYLNDYPLAMIRSGSVYYYPHRPPGDTTGTYQLQWYCCMEGSLRTLRCCEYHRCRY